MRVRRSRGGSLGAGRAWALAALGCGLACALSTASPARAQTPEADLAGAPPDPREAWLAGDEGGDAVESFRHSAPHEPAPPPRAEPPPQEVVLAPPRTPRPNIRVDPRADRTTAGAATATLGEVGEEPGVPTLQGGNEPYEWFLLPMVGFSSDIGFAGALLGMLFHYEEGYEPFRDKLQLITLLTSKLVQFHELVYERVGLFGQPLRLELAASFTATPVGHYCGLGNQVTCSREEAEEGLRSQGWTPSDDDWDQRLGDYYRFRVMRPLLRMALRWAPVPDGIELTMMWEGQYAFSGYVGEEGPYPGSLYAQDYPDGEEGFMSELRLGAVMDRRNHERRPSRGWVAGAALRGSSFLLGSDWDYAGFNLAGAYYLPMSRNERLVLAMRGVVDLIHGDAPTTALGSIGGFWNDMAFGGQLIGRGVRGRRYIGRIKVLGQTEVRWAMWGEPGDFQGLLVAFADAGWIGVDYDDFGGELNQILVSFGAGAGVYWGQSFLLRFDVGLSALEDFEPQFYLSLKHPY